MNPAPLFSNRLYYWFRGAGYLSFSNNPTHLLWRLTFKRDPTSQHEILKETLNPVKSGLGQ
jgi:hypothetical protein